MNCMGGEAIVAVTETDGDYAWVLIVDCSDAEQIGQEHWMTQRTILANRICDRKDAE